MHASLCARALALAACLPALALAAPTVRTGPNLQLARKGHQAVRLYDGRVLIVGGATSDSRGPGAELFDPRSGRFSAVENSDERFGGYVGAARLNDGRVCISWSTNRGLEVWLFDPKTDRVSRANADLPYRGRHRATRLRDGRVLLSGGYHKLQAYDPRSDSFVDRVGTRKSHHGYATHTATPLRGGEVVLMAGGKFTDKFSTSSKDATQLVRAGGTHKPDALKVKRYDHAAIALDTRQALIVGGRRSRGWFRSHAPVGSLEVFDLDREGFTKVDSLHYPRWGTALVRDGVDVLITGGANRAAELYTVEVYSIRSQRVLDGERFRLKHKRAFHTATRLSDGRILVVGGEAEGTRLRSSELIRR